MYELQNRDLLGSRPSREFLGGSKNKKQSFVEVLLVRRTLVLYLCNLAPESERDLLLDKLLLTSSGLREENDLVLATPETVRLVELVKRVHHGGFDGTVRTFLADYPGGSAEELVKLSSIKDPLDDWRKALQNKEGPASTEAVVGEPVELGLTQAVLEKKEDTPEPAVAVDELASLTHEWRGTIRSMWQMQNIQVKLRPTGSWKVLQEALEGTAAFKFKPTVLSGDTRRAAAPSHLLLFLNFNQAAGVDVALEVQTLYKCFAQVADSAKDKTEVLQPGVVMVVFEGLQQAHGTKLKTALGKLGGSLGQQRLLTVGYQQHHVETLKSERLKSASTVDVLEPVHILTGGSLKVPTLPRKHFAGTNKGNLMAEVPLRILS